MAENTTETHDPTLCPICGVPFNDRDNDRCDHEAGWYRQWLATEQERLDLALRALDAIAKGATGNQTPAVYAEAIHLSITQSRQRG